MNRLTTCILTLLIISVTPAILSAAADKPDSNLESLAKKGDIPAMIQLGKWYSGISSNKDNGKAAAEWFKKAMEKGSDEGRWLYAGALAEGLTGKVKIKDAIKVIDGKKDKDAGEEFYRKGRIALETEAGQANLILAAEMGSEKALYILGNLFINNKIAIRELSAGSNRKNALAYMERAASAGYIPAIMWLVNEYGADEKIKQADMQKKLSGISHHQITIDDIKIVSEFRNWNVLERIATLKSRFMSQSDYIDLMRELLQSPAGKVERGKPLATLAAGFRETSDTVLIDKFKPIADFVGGDLTERLFRMELFTGLPYRQLRAIRKHLSHTVNRIPPAIRDSAIDTLISLTNKGYIDAHKDLCKIIMEKYDLTNRNVTILCNAYDNGVTDGLDKILQAALRRNKIAVNWLESHAATGSADIQGTLGCVYGADDSPFYDKKKAKHWLETAARNGKPEYKKNFPELFEKESPQPKTSDKNNKKRSNTSFQESGLKR